jgi:C4-dicarboxylate-specific signal transduction histidine kinase
MIDITESKRAQDKLLATQTELARVTSLTAAGQMAASMAHEIKQPLAAIVTGGSAGLRWLSKPTPDLEEVRPAREHRHRGQPGEPSDRRHSGDVQER